MSKANEMGLVLHSGSLEAYVQSVGAIPVLSVEEERRLALQYRLENDLGAARQLVMSNLRFVVHIARGYSGYGLSQSDLVQEGNIGLMKAVKRFDPDMNVRLVSYAVHWIRAEIHEFILRNWRIVKVATTKAQRKLFFNLRSAKKRLAWFGREEVNAVAQDLGVRPEDVIEMEARISGYDTSFDPYGDRDEESERNLAPAAYLTDTRNDPTVQLEQSEWESHNEERLHHALDGLDERSRDILQQRWLADDKMTLQDLADKYQVSAERIRQLEKSAIKKLRSSLEA
ncbi:MAG: RNA polymerase sigma factor RpoH [Gammaproteobacteria bacterium]|nr:RNA polymerase sigma factor RpoH [Gammaproteobacteria bacterium]